MDSYPSNNELIRINKQIYKERIERELRCKATFLQKDALYEPGKLYYEAYPHTIVLCKGAFINESGFQCVLVEEVRGMDPGFIPGRMRSHCTSLDYRFELEVTEML